MTSRLHLTPRTARFAVRLTGAFVGMASAFAMVVSTQAQTDQLADSVKQQIDGILELKSSFSSGEQKLSTALVLASRQAQGKALGAATNFANGAAVDGGGMVKVSIRANASDSLLQAITAYGGSVDAVAPSNDVVEATMPIWYLESFASREDVRSIRQPARARTNVGSLTTQGVITHRSAEVNANGVTGAGVKVGVMSDSALPAEVAALIASGDLGPGTTVLPGQQGPSNGSNEGTAMMEIVQDMCPASQLYFATAFNSEASFASNIIALGAAGCRVVVDDVSYDDEFPFQDGIIAQAVNTYVQSGGIYFSSAANDGNKTNNSATVWEGDFTDGGPYTIPPLSSPRPTPSPTPSASSGYTVHNFGSALSNQLLQTTRAGILFWADPIGASSNDYDLFITNSAGTTLKGFSIDTQNGTGDPIEEVVASSLGGNWINNTAGDRLVVVKKSTAAVRAIRVESLFGESQLAITTPGATRGHNAGRNTQSCAATFWNSARIGTKPFNGTNNPIEPFSSDGLRKIFFNPDGTPITPGNFLFATNGGLTLQKPDFTAADGVTTKTPGFNPFYGTSAAAPHAAAIAALVISAKPTLTNTQVSNIMHSTALDNMAAGPDRDGGVGVVMAAQAVQSALAITPPATRPPIDRLRDR